MEKTEIENELEKIINKRISNLQECVVLVNNNIPFFTKKAFDTTIEGEPQYFEIDEYGRSNGGIALISNNTKPLLIKKKLQYPDPYGWTKNLNGKYIFERCHIIAYNLSARANNKKNIFIGTKTLNSSIMKRIENEVSNYVKKENVEVLYRVTVKYKGKNQIPTGVLIEAQSKDGNFKLCKFCYNIQKNISIDYSDGTIIADNRNPMSKLVYRIKNSNNVKQIKKNKDYIINRKNNIFHIDSECKLLKGIESKYINEVTAKEKDLIKAKLKPCKNCIKKS